MLTSLPELLQQPLVQTLIVCASLYGGVRADLKSMHKRQDEHTQELAIANKRIDGVIFSQLRRSPPG